MPDGSRKWKKRVLTAVPREAEGTKAAFVTATVEGAAIRATSSRRGVNPERPSCYNDRGVRVVEHFWTGWMSVFPGHKNKLLFRVHLHYSSTRTSLLLLVVLLLFVRVSLPYTSIRSSYLYHNSSTARSRDQESCTPCFPKNPHHGSS